MLIKWGVSAGFTPWVLALNYYSQRVKIGLSQQPRQALF
ncbi:hypothetical protein THOD04_70016 [Vibrio owensii]|nr:hypothetical protein THOD04_70016 [Vibrio owensii]